MSLSPPLLRVLIAPLLALALLDAQAADTVATVKSVQGEATLERNGARLPLTVGTALERADVVVTGADGAAGLSFEDATRVSLGANSRLSIDRFRFNRTTQGGEFDATLSKGRMAVVSGRIAKSQLDAMKVRTPTTLLGVRGTEFVVDAGS
jgi:hypothetical protein